VLTSRLPTLYRDTKAAGSKKWVRSWIEQFSKFQVTSYANNFMASDEKDLQNVYPAETMQRLKAMKEKHDPNHMFKTSPWDYKSHE
jgi:hypothetical protein